MPILSCWMANWKVTSSVNCQPGNEAIVESKIAHEFEVRAVGEFCRNRLVGCGAIGVHPPIRQIPGHRRLWTDRLLLNAADLAPGAGFGVEPYCESRNGSVLCTTGKGRRGPRSCAH